MKFNIGDIVQIACDYNNRVTKYYAENSGIPQNLLIHGRLITQDCMGVIKARYGEYYLVRYTTDNGKQVQLGFTEDLLTFKEKGPESPNLFNYYDL